MTTNEHWDDDIARAISARTGVLRQARRAGDRFANEYRHRTWPRTPPAAPVAVYLARDGLFQTLAFDIDATGAEGVRQAAALGAVLTASGINFVEAESSPVGGRHLICTWNQGLDPAHVAEVAQRLQEVAPGLDPHPLLNPGTGCIRPPGSVHRDGGASRLITPRAVALWRLTEANSTAAFLRLHDALTTTTQPPKVGVRNRDVTAALLLGLPRVGGEAKLPRARRELTVPNLAWMSSQGARLDSDRSAATARATLSVVNAGWSFPEYLTLVRDPSVAAFDHLRRRRSSGGLLPRDDTERRARRMWRQRLAYAVANPPTGPVPTVTEVEACAAAAATSHWPGQGGPRARAVLEALIELGRRLGTATVSKDVRSLAEQTGGSPTAAATALQRLRRNGWIELVTEARGPLAATYRLTTPARPQTARKRSGTGWTLAPTPHPAAGGGAAPELPFTLGLANRAHDALTSEGLGRYAGLLLDLLAVEPLPLAHIVERTGWDRRTVRKHLRRLASHALALPTPESHPDQSLAWQVVPDRLDDAARALRATGTVARRREQITQDRLTWAWWQADFDAERGWATRRGRRKPGYRNTKDGTPCPAMPFPLTDAGHRDWRAAASLVANGHGPTPTDHTCFWSTVRATSAPQQTTAARTTPSGGAPSYDDQMQLPLSA